MDGFVLDYFAFVFFSVVSILQLISAFKKLNGLLIIKRTMLTVLFWGAIIITSFIWFFASETRNLSDTTGGLDGNQTAGLFTLAAFLGFVVTLLVASFVNRNMIKKVPDWSDGINSLRYCTYTRLLGNFIRQRNGIDS